MDVAPELRIEPLLLYGIVTPPFSHALLLLRLTIHQ